MASLKYMIANMPVSLCKQKNPSVPVEDQTVKKYKHYAIQFGELCKAQYRCKTPDECRAHLQDYTDWLVAQGRTPSTIHTYLAGAYRWFGEPLETIVKPARVVSNNARSRGKKAVDGRSDAQQEASPRLWDFAMAVGIRRQEYKSLRRDDFVYDESGYPCVRVKRGKGGKYQEQRIAPEDVDFVRGFFDGSADKVFSAVEMANKIDLHYLQALRAQSAYMTYLTRLEAEATYRAQLTEEVRRRWVRLCGRKWNPKQVEGYYYIRGGNRRLALENGLLTKYDRLAVMAVSIFHLSHWRCDVTVDNYLLAF